MVRLSSTLLAALAGIGSVSAQTCNTNTISSSPPSDNAVALQSYSYCGGTLDFTVYVENTNYNKVVTVYYTNRQNVSNPLSAVQLGYTGSVPNTNFEYWNADVPVWVDGITEFLNVTYIDEDAPHTYFQILDLPVNASGAPAPTLPSPPAPYATPSGFSADITKYLATSGSSRYGGVEGKIAQKGMFTNVNPAVQGAVPGVVVAARSGPSYPQTDPDYEFNWVRDSSLTMNVVYQLYSAATNKLATNAYEQILFHYATARATEQTDPNLQTGLGEPKFYLNNTIFSGPWGRPQNDGAATSAVTLMQFANAYLAKGGSIKTVKQQIYDSSAYPNVAPVQKDLLFVASNWSSPSFDIWEEEESDQFYTRLVQRRAMVQGITFATKMGDKKTAKTLSSALKAITPTFSDFWDPNRQIILYEYGPVLHDKSSYLDTAVILGIIHGYAGDGFYSYTNDYVLSTAVRIGTCFLDVYQISNRTSNEVTGGILAPPIGRYPEDVYNGTGTEPNGGNPWYLCTAAFSQFMYAASAEYTAANQIKVTTISQDFFNYFAPEAGVKAGKTYTNGTQQFSQVVNSLNGWGDAFMRTISYYTPEGGSLTEEFNRNTGAPQGAADLTWSYASVLSAAIQRAVTQNNPTYVKNLANLGVQQNYN